MSAIYRGFSIHNYARSGTTKSYDVDLVKRNLLTHIYTAKGERLGMTKFGTRIPDMLFEQLTPDAVDAIQEDLEMVFNYDPRIKLNKLQVVPLWDQNAVIATADLMYIELNIQQPMVIKLSFD